MSGAAVTRSRSRKLDSKTRRRNVRDCLLAAIVELGGQGEAFSTTSVDRLTTTAGVSRATFYKYFDSKADLLHAWFDDVEAELAGVCGPWLDNEVPSSPAELELALRAIAKIFIAHQSLLAACMEEARHDAGLRRRLGGSVVHVREDLRKHMVVGQQNGWVDPELLPAETAAWLVWFLERGLGQIVAGRSPREANKRIATLASMIWHLLYVFPR